ncbi:MAG TPA: prepilin-type N-terminal cleavage/methylation domain-containing protein [Sedimentisphaerales bacterium]|nr:prepilin-type N-terminal cleavage/methylation domain-containing protein [Sedimentisphaerales bacterium]
MLKRKGFTLIELLVVIAIIAILMAILMPALKRAKMQVRGILCKANLNQYGLAARMYLDDNDGGFPYSFTWLYKDGGRNHRWHDGSDSVNLNLHPELGGEMWPYLKDKDIHMCPEFNIVARMVGGHSNESIPFDPQYSYCMNSYLNGDAWGAVPAQYRTNMEKIRKESQVKNPQRVFFFSEENTWAIPGLSSAAVNDNNLRSTPPGNTDCFATYHSPPGGDLDMGYAYAVFVDSHVEQVSARPRPNTFILSWPSGPPIPDW